MITIRKSNERGHFDHGWLDTYHTFSFGEYYDPGQMGFRSLRVLNEDWVQPGHGFPMHGHREMEILTWVLEGALVHHDSLGNGSVIVPGELQRMSAGTGIEHSEGNASATEPVHLLQIWLRPARRGGIPGHEQRRFDLAEAQGRWRTLASGDGRDGALTIGQDARLDLARLAEGDVVVRDLAPGRSAWLHLARGAVTLDGHDLEAGDGAAIVDVARLEVAARRGSEVLLFDLA